MLLLPAVTTGTPTLDVIHHCDALTLLRALPSGSMDMALTSPPYDNLRRYNGYSFEFEPIAREVYRVLKWGGVLVWVVGDSVVDGSETLTSFRQALYFKEVGFNVHQTIIFHDPGTAFPDPTRYTRQTEYVFILSKGKPITIHLDKQPTRYPGVIKHVRRQREQDGRLVAHVNRIVNDFGTMGNVWSFDVGFNKTTTDAMAFLHPAMFPERLARRCITSWSNPGDTVLDFFGGSGTTAKMARNLGRHYITCDISSEYVELAKKRLRDTDPFQDKHVSPGVIQHSLFSMVTP